MSLRPAAGKILRHGRTPTYYYYSHHSFGSQTHPAILRSHTLFAVPPRTHRPALDALHHRQFGTRGTGSGESEPSGGSNHKAPQNDKPPTKITPPEDESHLNWKDRQQAPKWMRRIAPTKGGKWPPSPQEAVILSAGVALFVWSWSDVML